MSISERVNIQVPIEKDIKEAWEEHVIGYGFDSIQSYIRFLAKADVDGRKVNFDEQGSLSPEAIARYDKDYQTHVQLREQGKIKSFDNADDLINDLLTE